MIDVAHWLDEQGLGRHAAAFRENGVGGDIVRDLTDADLKGLGLNLGDRKRLLKAIAALDPVPSAPAPPAYPREAERRQLTVVFVDLVGSTTLAARLDPEDLRGVIRPYQDACAAAIGRHGGHLAQFLGDGVLAHFGHPWAHEDDPERAARAGLELVEAIGALAPPGGPALRARVGVATGLVVVGDAGGGHEHGAIGETPNRAARLQAAAEPGAVVVDDGTRRLLGGMFDCRDLGPVAARGFPEPMRAWRVLRRGAVGSRSEALHGSASARAPLVGRDEEIELLRRSWARAEGGEGRVVLLSGEPGIGKSRLAAGLLERLAGEPRTVLRCFCSPHHRDSPLFPVVSQLERAAGFDRDDAPRERLGKLRALLGRATGDGDEAALIADLLGLCVDGRRPLPDLTPQRRKERLLDALLAQLAGLAARRPVLVVFEDAHWADATSLELLGLMVERVRRLRALLLVTFRPEFRPPWARLAHVTPLALRGLGWHAAASLVGRTAGGAPLPGEVVDEIVERAGGVPLFVEELTKAVVEADWHEGAAEGVLAVAPLPACAVPAALYAPLAARLDRLGPAREVAQVGAAIGREFPYELLTAVAGRPEGELREALDRLVDAGLVSRAGEPPRARFLFKHSLVQDAAYGTLLRARRRELHARIAQVLAGLFAGTAEARPELLAHHCARGGLVEEAVGHWGEAARRAIARSAVAEAAGHLRRALELLPALADTPARWRRELELQTALGTALTAAEGCTAPATGRAHDRAHALCERLGDTPGLVPIAIGRCTYHLMRAEMGAALNIAEDLLRRAEREGSLEARLAGHRLVGTAVLYAGRLGRAHRHLETAADLLGEAGEGAARMAGGKNALAMVPTHLAILLLLRGRYDQAGAQIAFGLAEARKLGRPPLLASTLAVAAWLHVLLGEDAPRRLVDALGELAADKSLVYWQTEVALHRGLALARAGETREGVALVREGAARYDAMGAAWHAPVALCLAAALAEGVEGLALVDEASARFERTGVRFLDAEACRVRGALLAGAGDAAGAEAQLAEAVGIARVQGAMHWELRAAASLARLWRGQGRCKEARDLLTPVHARFAKGSGAPDSVEAKRLLQLLA